MTKKTHCKQWYQSRTIWLHIAIAGLAITEALQGQIAAGTTLGIISVAGIILRVATTSPLLK